VSRRTQRAPSLRNIVTAAPQCTHCHKAAYPTKAAARDAYNHIHDPDAPHRFYMCPSGAWHWTSQITRPA
jgi:dissimilatory sulfite reductase (desulfoviridin) alpha/beta subunit